MVRLQITDYRLQMRIVILFSVLCSLFSVCYAEVSSSAELINSPRNQAVKFVVYRGEVVGDVMLRGDYAWVNINDGQAAIGAWMPKKLAQEIKYTGGYKTIGDLVEVNGIFNRNCSIHGGDLDIHVKAIKILRPGYAVSENISNAKFKLAIILFIVCLMVIMVYFVKIGYKRQRPDVG
jgi:hypothetical protein